MKRQALQDDYNTLMLMHRELRSINDVCNPYTMHELARMAYEAAAAVMAALQRLSKGPFARLRETLSTICVTLAQALLELAGNIV